MHTYMCICVHIYICICIGGCLMSVAGSGDVTSGGLAAACVCNTAWALRAILTKRSSAASKACQSMSAASKACQQLFGLTGQGNHHQKVLRY